MIHLPTPRPAITIQADSNPVYTGLVLTAKCSVGYAPYAYVWIAYGDTEYYSKIMIVLHQHCIVEPKGRSK